MANKKPNIENLKPPINKQTPKEQREFHSKGGIASGKARREKKTMKQMLEYLLERETENDNGGKSTNLEEISVSLIKQALKGNVRAFEVLRDTIGQNPSQKIDIEGNAILQKVFVSKDEKEQAEKHIDSIIEAE